MLVQLYLVQLYLDQRSLAQPSQDSESPVCTFRGPYDELGPNWAEGYKILAFQDKGIGG